MAQVPRPQLGKHLTSGVLTAQAVAADGTLSDGTAVIIAAATPSIHNVARNISLSGEVQETEINGLNTSALNNVNDAYGWSMDLEIFKVNNGTDPDPLVELLLPLSASGVPTTEYFKFVWVTGTATGSIATHTFYGKYAGHTTGQQGRAEQIASLRLSACDPGIAQYARVVT